MDTKRKRWSLRRPRKTAPMKCYTAPTLPAATKTPPKTPWLSDAEDLLNSIVSFAWRAVGSLLFGFMALFRKSPTKRLRALEAEGQVLSWAILLVTSSALFSALFPAAFEMVETTPGYWLDKTMKATNVADYLERFLPTMGVGLLACLVACLPSWLLRGPKNLQGPRLLASTVFAMSLIVSLVSSAAFRYLVVANKGEYLAENMKPLIGSAGASLILVLVSVAVWVIPVCLACAVAAGRSSASAPLGWAHHNWRRPLRLVFGVSASLIAFLVPIALFASATAATRFLEPKLVSVKGAAEPEEGAEFITREPRCVQVEKNGKKVLECILIAQTVGKGPIFLDFGSPALILSSEILGEPKVERYRLKELNAVSESYELESRELDVRTVEPAAAWDFDMPGTAVGASGVVAIELGKPLFATLRLNIPEACKQGKVYAGFSVGLYHWVYLRAKPLRTSPGARNAFAAVGPWRIPVEAFNKECPPEPPG